MLRVGLIKHHCPFRAVAAALSSTPIIAHLQFLPFLSERSSVGCFEGIGTLAMVAGFYGQLGNLSLCDRRNTCRLCSSRQFAAFSLISVLSTFTSTVVPHGFYASANRCRRS